MFALGRLVSVMLSTKFSPAFMLLCNIVRFTHSLVYVLDVVKLCFDVSPVEGAFYSACNSIFSRGSGLDEIALLHLQEVCSLSVLMYTTPALLLSQTDQ